MVAPVPFFVDRGTPMRILEEALALAEDLRDKAAYAEEAISDTAWI